MADRAWPSVDVFAKAPVPGMVKTRLIPALGAEGAACLHAALVHHTLRTVREAGFNQITLWCAPDERHPFFAACEAAYGLRLASQSEGDLGARMTHVFHSHAPCLLMGSDCPSITTDHLHACATALASHDAVFLPAEDGGYGLVGLNQPAPSLFRDIAWSTPAVMAQTRERLGALRLTHAEPAMIWDVDEPADVSRLVASGLLAPSVWERGPDSE